MPETLEITAIGAGGDGIAHTAAGSVFVPQALPGERVHARIAGQRAQVEEWLSESPDRIAPPCTHFPACGGCVLQHWAPAPYAEWKRARLVEALARAGFADAPVAPLVTTPPASRQRADLGLERLPDGRVQIGFHQRGTTALVPMRECHVLLPSLVALLPPLAEALRGLEGLRRLGSAVINMLASGPDILLRTDAPLTMPDRRALAALAQSAGIPRIAWAGKGARAEVAAQFGPVRHMLSGVELVPTPGAFLQASVPGEAAIITAMLEGLPRKLPPRAAIADLYAGLGTLSIPLAARGRVTAFESVPEAVTALAAAAGKAGIRVQAVKRDLDRQPLAGPELKGYAAVVLDPPYAGAAEQVGLLAQARVPTIVYVSCNPVALAKDAKALHAAGYRIVAATPVDQFLWSPHLESVVAFTRG
ncbi:RNA methyltransferase [Siccirubricoccus deserti]|uniref:Class I SAM-dependent RNA methyltransferase n=1 Tax=Siccirubricoccus deserti TaxID=2013562 RepID=A0A9X0UD67_9PROT|nr:RsmD family RNA methyltransferase [Siccirubricoccus deserti]MBC4015326.1 class I SAM-dependent RNA methyltransferase [Siccirubricoccus deserti]GGC40786.1 RNA methyltransferase [Siccirubricoccus deserti]